MASSRRAEAHQQHKSRSPFDTNSLERWLNPRIKLVVALIFLALLMGVIMAILGLTGYVSPTYIWIGILLTIFSPFLVPFALILIHWLLSGFLPRGPTMILIEKDMHY
eukprot:scpid69448/ scgid24534/ 